YVQRRWLAVADAIRIPWVVAKRALSQAWAILGPRRHSSAVEQLFRKQQVLGSNPSVGSTPSLVAMTENALFLLPALRRARDLIDRDYAEPLDLDAMAGEAGYSRFHFARAFRAAYGE